MVMSPVVGRSPAIAWSRVDFPDPFGPTRAVTPGSIVSSSISSAFESPR